jgi:acyl-homoserine-lactone acylase
MTRRLLLLLLPLAAFAQTPDQERWKRHSSNVQIIRDHWGIAHVYGKTDADTVFGAIYAQAEDDFNRIETNYLNSMGRLAEAEGEGKIWQDLRMKMWIDPEELKRDYQRSPAWLQKLMNAWADGLNYYLSKHPQAKPRVIQRFEPWMALSFTEGSIGGDIESIRLEGIRDLYGGGAKAATGASAALDGQRKEARQEVAWSLPPDPPGSNGFAIAPSNTANKNALLLINPHTTFFFRSELQMVSEEGLNAYGASTWGQFFIYQGFNDRVGWMHTSANVDVIDEFIETIARKDGKLFYKHGSEWKPVTERVVVLPYKAADGSMAQRTITLYRTHHGPIIRKHSQSAAGGEEKWIAVQLMHKPVEALQQSYLRTKARNYAEYRKTMELKANSSNNTIYADADGAIAYFHGNFIPRRDTQFDFTKPVDGSNPATDWKGLHDISETPTLLNPKSGWLYNTNNWPWSAAGESSPRKSDYPVYVEEGAENARGLHAIRVLQGKKDFTLDSLLAAAYDSYLPWFEGPVRDLVKAWDALPASDPLKEKLREQVAMLKVRADLAGNVLGGPVACWSDRAGVAPRSGAAEDGGSGIGQARRGLWHMEDRVGRHQSISASHR